MQNLPRGEPAGKSNLRPYQLDAIARVREAMRRGHRRAVLVVPTGGGKTRIAAEVCRAAVALQKRVLWLAHRTELVGQAADALSAAGLNVGVVMAGHAVDPTATVQVASIQTLVARPDIRPPADLVVADEAHHMGEGAEEWVSLLDAYPTARVLGLTATPERGDGTGLAPIFTALVMGVTVRQLTAEGFLVPCEVVRPDAWLKSKHGPGAGGGNPLAQEPMAAYQQHSPGQQGFLFAPTVAEAERYAEEFEGAGIASYCVHALTPPQLRAAALAAFRRGEIRMLTNVYVFTEGTDLPMASVCILARNASTAGMFLQMVGRVLRPHPGKRAAMLIDLPGVSHVHGMPEDERLWKLEGKACVTSGQVCPVCSAPVAVTPSVEFPCPKCAFAPRPKAPGEEGCGTTITGDAVEKYARMIAQGPEQRRQTLQRWLAGAFLKGHKASSVKHKWRAVYGEPPPETDFIRAAKEAGY